jgi:hypothetical protein
MAHGLADAVDLNIDAEISLLDPFLRRQLARVARTAPFLVAIQRVIDLA